MWNTGETTQTIDVDTTGTYWVEVFGNNGCSAFDDIVVTEYGISRDLSNQWYFGERAGIDFNENPPAALVDDNLMSSPEGCATISDVDGALLFYTNGSTIWNKDDSVMVNGTNIGGDSTATQSVLILPFADDQTLFYVFTTEQVYGDFDYKLRVSVVDIKDDVARGSVVIKGVPLMDFSAERVTASGFDDSKWLLGHEFGNNNFQANFIDETGIGATVHTPLGTFLDVLDEIEASSYFRFSPDSLVAMMVPGENTIDLLTFDDQEGTLSGPITIDTEEPASNPLYGLEFSQESERLYVTTTGSGSKLIQYDLDALGTDDAEQMIASSKFDGYPTGNNYGALQMGPNGSIYLVQDNSSTVISIDQPSGDDANAGFNPTGINIDPLGEGRIARLGLPNFTQDVNDPSQPPGFVVESACFGQALDLIATGTSIIDMYEWTFDENASPQSGSGDSISVVYNTLGEHVITLRIFNRCGYDSLFMDTVEVFAVPDNPTIPDNVAICDGEVVLEATEEDDPNLSYIWSTGDTTRTITVTEPAVIEVALLTGEGCPSDTSEVFVGAVISVDLGPDQNICQDEQVIPLDAQNAVGVFNWTVDTAAASNTRFQDINTSVPGNFIYALEYTEQVSGCIARDTVNINILESPQATTLGTPPTDCASDDGTIEVNITSSGNFSYGLSGLETRSAQLFDGPGTPPLFTSLSAGTYFVDLQNQVTGCANTIPVLLEDNAPFDLIGTAVPSCGSEGDLQLELTGLPTATVNIQIFTDEGDTVRSLQDVLVPIETIENFDTGLYIIQVQEIGGLGCVQIDSVNLSEQFPQSNFDLLPIQELCGTRDEVSLTPGTNGDALYTWTNASGETIGIGENVQIAFAGDYVVTATGEELCPISDTVEIDINPFPNVEIVENGDLCFGDLTLTAVADSAFAGPFSYQWLFGEERTEVFQTQIINPTEPGRYQVRLIDPTIGCEATSNPVQIRCNPRVRAPNAFSPNGNGRNEVFFVFPNNFVDNFEIFVYNRWGELVFYSDNFGFEWNGDFRGKLLPVGTYAYVMKFTSNNDPQLGVIEQYGSITLVR